MPFSTNTLPRYWRGIRPSICQRTAFVIAFATIIVVEIGRTPPSRQLMRLIFLDLRPRAAGEGAERHTGDHRGGINDKIAQARVATWHEDLEDFDCSGEHYHRGCDQEGPPI